MYIPGQNYNSFVHQPFIFQIGDEYNLIDMVSLTVIQIQNQFNER